ncbi:rap guanine nucleotide exchange factor 3-like isoform X2, partial [Clarias magur]
MHLFRSYNYQVFPDRYTAEKATVRGISWTPLPEALDTQDTMKQFLSDRVLKAARVVYSALKERNPDLIRDRKHHLKTYRQCCSGKELVDWLMKLNDCSLSRNQTVGMWQVLIDEGIIVNVKQELDFQDKDTQFYRFMETEFDLNNTTSEKDTKDDELQEGLSFLVQMGPDALLNMKLRKCPSQRTAEDVEVIYEELLHVKAVAHLSTSVRKELAAVLVFESYAKAGTVLFSQGDKGTSWYIIWKGSVNVITHGKGLVTTLHEGEDFGQLALVNDAPRAATIILREDNCHFLRVDKQDFIRILKKLKEEVMDDTRLSNMLKEQLRDRRKTRVSENGCQTLMKLNQKFDWFATYEEPAGKCHPIRAQDTVLYEIFNPEHKAITLMLPVNCSVQDIMDVLVDSGGDHVVVKMNSSGERVQLKLDATAVFTSLGLNERLFLCTASQVEQLTPLNEQLGPERSTVDFLEQICSKEIASHLTNYDWELFMAMHETELIYYIFGRNKFPGTTTANLERFVRHFNKVQYWVVTELCLCEDLMKRSMLLKKFIKVAAVLKELKNLNLFFAVMFGLSNSAVQRLYKTWERLSSKTKRIYCAYERLLDPSHNHRAYRLAVAKLNPPYIPLMPLILKDMTFIHEGNRNFTDNLVNFEKMRMIAKTVKIVQDCRSQPYVPSSPQKGFTERMFLESPAIRVST